MTLMESGRRRWTLLQPMPPITREEFLRGFVLNLLLVTLSGVLASYLFLPHAAWWLAGVALVPLLVALRRTQEIKAAGRLMLLFGVVFFASTLTWLGTIFHTSVLGIYFIAALPWVLFGAAYRWLAGLVAPWANRRQAGLVMVLMTPVLFLAVEWVRCEGWYFNLSWAQFGFAPISAPNGMALYPYIGVYGVTFLIVLVNAAVAEVLLTPTVWRRKALVLLPMAAVMMLLGLWLNLPVGPPALADTGTATVRVLLLQDESGDLEQHIADTLQRKDEHPALIVWPEISIPARPLEDPAVLAKLQGLTRAMRATLVLGCKESAPLDTPVDALRRRGMLAAEGGLFRNIALVIAPDGTVLGRYAKTHPIPLFSDGVPGTEYPTFATPAGRLGIGICFDLDFATTARTLTQHGAEILIAPTFDAADWTALQHDQHAAMSRARAAETGRWIVRATSSGFSQLIDPQGEQVVTIGNGLSETALGEAVPRTEMTPYVRFGYLLPYVCLGLSLLWALGAGVITWRRYRARKQRPDGG
jgi:apolipoprotein N-acyltransferase